MMPLWPGGGRVSGMRRLIETLRREFAMKTIVLITGAVLVAFASLLAGEASSQDGKTPSIKDVMNKLHKGAPSPLARLKTDLSAPSPDWAALEKASKDFVILGAALAKNDPPKGDKSSWAKLADSYFQDA